MNNNSLHIFQKTATLERQFLSKKGKNLNKSFLAFYNSLKTSIKSQNQLTAVKDKQESISGFILKKANFSINSFTEETVDGDDISRLNTPTFLDEAFDYEENISKNNLEFIKKNAEDRRKEIRHDRKIEHKHNFLRVNYKGVWKKSPVLSFSKSKRKFEWLTSTQNSDESDSQKRNKSMVVESKKKPKSRDFRINNRGGKNGFVSSMRTITLPKMRNVSIEKKLSKSYCFDSGIQNPCFNFKTDSQRKKEKRILEHEKAKKRYEIMHDKKFKLKSLKKKINELKKERARRIFEQFENSVSHKKNSEKLVKEEESQNSILDEVIERERGPIVTLFIPQISKKRQFSHLFFKKLKRKKHTKKIDT